MDCGSDFRDRKPSHSIFPARANYKKVSENSLLALPGTGLQNWR